MLFSSYTFLLLFLPASYLGYRWLVEKGGKPAVGWWLLFCSLCFYAYWDYRYLALLLGSICFNFYLGRRIQDSQNWKRLLIFVGLTANIGLLFYFKYVPVLHEYFWVAQAKWEIGRVIIPLGISFFTLQQLAFLIDCYRGLKQNYSLLEYALYVSFFPHLLAGPILYHADLITEFRKKIGSDFWGKLYFGSARFLLGLAKKLVIADGLEFYVLTVYAPASGDSPTFFVAWLGIFAYSLQIYFDFSGYSDMAVGLGEIFGFRIPENFAEPLKANNYIERWNRWHLTLTRLLREYVYIPLGGGKRGLLPQIRNVWIVFLLSGIWHGAGLNFVIWGALCASLYTLNLVWRSWRRPIASDTSGLGPRSLVKQLILFLIVSLEWVCFRSASVAQISETYQTLFVMKGISLSTPYPKGPAIIAVFAALLIALLAPSAKSIIQHLKAQSEPVIRWQFKSNPIKFNWEPLAFSLLLVICFLYVNRMKEFLYIQF